MAVGTIDMAVWDATAKIAGKPLYQLLAERYGNGTPNPRVFVYAAGGYYYPGKGLEALQREMESYLARGYSVVKMKIGGATLVEDCERIESVLKILGPGQQLAVDADGDGHINLVASLPDVFASIANYFRAHGWQTGQPVTVRAEPSATATPTAKYVNVLPQTPLAQFASDGYVPTTKVDPALPANLLPLAGADGPEYWLTFRNFYVITRYNKSPMYALAVTQLADAIARGVATAPAAQ